MSETKNTYTEIISDNQIDENEFDDFIDKKFQGLSTIQKEKLQIKYDNLKNKLESSKEKIIDISHNELSLLKELFKPENKEQIINISNKLNIEKEGFLSFLDKFKNTDAIIINLNNVLKLIDNSKIENSTKKEILDKIKSLILNNNLEKGNYANFYNFSKTISSVVNPIIKENEKESIQTFKENEKESIQTFKENEKESIKKINKERTKDINKAESYFPGIKINKKSFDNLKGGETNNLRPEKMLLDLKEKIESFSNLSEKDINKLKNIVSTKFNIINNYVEDINKDYSSKKIDTTEFSSERFKIQTKFENQFTFVNTELLPNLAFLNKYEKETGKGVIADKIKKIREKWNNMTIDNDGDLSGGAFDFFDPNLEEVGELKNKKGESFIKKEDAIKEVNILSKKDKEIKEKAEMTFYALIASQIAVETAGGLAGTVAGGGLDIYDVFSKDEALVVLGQKMGLIQKDFAMEKTFIDNVLAGIGLLPGATQAIKGTKLAKYLKTLTGNKLNSFFNQIDKVGQKMGLDKGVLNTWVRDFMSIDGKVAVNTVKRNAALPKAKRLEEAKRLLGGKEFNDEQRIAIRKAHDIGINKVFEYTTEEIFKKAKILKEAGFQKDEIRTLMESGIIGKVPETEKSLLKLQKNNQNLSLKYSELSKQEQNNIIVNSDLANIVYEDIFFKNLNKQSTYKGFKIKNTINSKSGLQAMILENKKGELTLSIRGTDRIIGKGEDFTSDKNIFLKNIPEEQFLELITFFKNVIAENPNKKITITGHSLGGVLAQLMTATFPSNIKHTYTYNSPGIINLKDIDITDNFIAKYGKEVVKHIKEFNESKNLKASNILVTNVTGDSVNIISGNNKKFLGKHVVIEKSLSHSMDSLGKKLIKGRGKDHLSGKKDVKTIKRNAKLKPQERININTNPNYPIGTEINFNKNGKEQIGKVLDSNNNGDIIVEYNINLMGEKTKTTLNIKENEINSIIKKGEGINISVNKKEKIEEIFGININIDDFISLDGIHRYNILKTLENISEKDINFFGENILNDKLIFGNKIGTGASGEIIDIGNGLVGKIFNGGDQIVFLESIIKEGKNINILSNLGIGPKFKGFIKGSNGKWGISMEKLDSLEMDDIESLKYINEKTLLDFDEKFHKLQNLGLKIWGDGQFMINKDGTISIIDVPSLHKILPNGSDEEYFRLRKILLELIESKKNI